MFYSFSCHHLLQRRHQGWCHIVFNYHTFHLTSKLILRANHLLLQNILNTISFIGKTLKAGESKSFRPKLFLNALFSSYPNVIVHSACSALFKPMAGLEMQRSIKDKFEFHYSSFIVYDIFSTLLFIMFIMYCFPFISVSGELYLMALFFA